ncbi:exodeoxyribonuclease V subunit gamma [Aquihabitans sp. G128]|nr:exodeoxyribonuclease V subunit gamma [Aquihabitans sp. G128]
MGHPLLRSWGRLPRETAVLVADGRAHGLPAPEVTDPTPPALGGTVLARLQAAIRSGEPPAEVAVPEAGDASVRFHAAHGHARQAEVARDAVLHLLAQDPTLREEDVVVLCPALDRFAPLVEAAFGPTAEAGLHSPEHAPALRYRIADRSRRGANPVVAGFDAVLDAAVGRFDATTVLDLLAEPAVRRRYAIDDDEQARVGDWVTETQVRWGLDPAHRVPLGVPATITTNTWQAALDRLLLGAAVADDELGFSLGDVVPFGIEGDDVDLAGRLADLLGHLGRLADAATTARPLVEWVDLLRGAAAALLAPDPDLPWQADALHRALAEVVDHATSRHGTAAVPLELVDLRRLLQDRLGGRQGRPDFFRGGVTVTSLEPLRALPFRVVVLLGVDQPAFASAAASNDDLAAAAPAVGDRDPRAEARQALLDAVLAAKDHLVVVREGHDLRTNQVVPPAVVVAELQEAVAGVAGAEAAEEVHHPRQPFDEKAFVPGDLGAGPWSFDPGALAGARARRSRALDLPPFLAEPLAPVEQSVIDLADLRRFVDHPIQWFLERRLELALPRAEDAVATSLPVLLENLDKWRVGDRLLSTLLGDGDLDRWERLERQLGTLPPGTLGQAKAAELLEVVAVLVAEARARSVRTGPPDLLDVDVALADGTRRGHGGRSARRRRARPGAGGLQHGQAQVPPGGLAGPGGAERRRARHRLAGGGHPQAGRVRHRAGRARPRGLGAAGRPGGPRPRRAGGGRRPLPAGPARAPAAVPQPQPGPAPRRGQAHAVGQPRALRRPHRPVRGRRLRPPVLRRAPGAARPAGRSGGHRRSSGPLRPVPVGGRRPVHRGPTGGGVVTGPERQPFHLLDPLPRAPLAIEASAGTGKTFTLASLATRYVAEQGVAAGELLVVTFTRAATSELRARTREKLAAAALHLAPGATSSDEELFAHLAATDREARLANLERAVTEFDAATITTIHGFATQALAALGARSGGDPDLSLVEDERDLQMEICADVLAQAATQGHPPEVLPKPRKLLEHASIALRTADLVLAPPPGQPGATEAHHLLRDLVEQVVARIGDHRRRRSSRSFDEILTELREELRGPQADAVKEALRSRYRVALIDEFQDTDPVQWDTFSALFADPAAGTSLVLVGDPKQAIYSFRGADIHTYERAVQQSDARSLGTNWRSDGAMLTAVETLLGGATFGDDEIAFVPVQPADRHAERRAVDRAGEPLPAVSLRLALGADLARTTGKVPNVVAGAADAAIAGDLVAHLRELFDGGRIPDAGHPDVDDQGRRPIRPSDVAVLTRSATEGELLQAELVAQGVPAVLARGGSVLDSPAADQWRVLLQGLARPSDPRRARAFALSWFAGRSAAWVDAATDADLAGIQDQLHGWAEALAHGGVDHLIRRIWSDSAVVARVLGRPDGDRAMTDLDHIAELLRTTAAGRGASVAALVAGLAEDPDPDPDAEIDGNLASRRIESEAEAVQILTIWVSKGLEFPIVCCPSLWRKKHGPTIFQDPDGTHRVLDVADGSGWPDRPGATRRKRLAAAELEGEDLRLLYVALTRAKHHALVWWTRGSSSSGSALARVLFARTGAAIDPEAFTAAKVALPDDADTEAALAPLVAASGGTISVGLHGRVRRPAERWRARTPDAAGPELAVATLGVAPDRRRHRWSFTAITAAGGDHAAADPEARPGGTDEATSGAVEPADDDGAREPVVEPGSARPGTSPLATLPAGAAFGTFVHAVLERVDFASVELDDDLAFEVDQELGWTPFDLTPVGSPAPAPEQGRELLLAGLRAAIETPLGPLFGDQRLRDLARTDRLDELDFELRLGEAGAVPTDRDLGALLVAHLGADHPFAPWANRLAAGAFGVELAGHLTGSIDLVARVAMAGGPDRFVVVDYKTNRLHPRGEAPGPLHYGAASMAAAMVEHHYPLQALLYAVALHRYLRWRQAGYDPAVHLGGAAYLFVRGMGGADGAVHAEGPDGVCSWALPPALVVAASDLLDGRRS